MNDFTKSLLLASIKKWEKNAKAEKPGDVTLGVSACPLCSAYWNGDCKGCPIYEKTLVIRCEDTPYRNAESAHDTWEECAEYSEDFEPLANEFRNAAQEEVEFLKSLLPDESTNQENENETRKRDQDSSEA